jgi:AP-3 complex subunit delta
MANNTSASSIIFQKTLSDLVKGIRSHKNNPTEYISQVIMECKQELHTTDPYLKSEAIRKLTYLQMVGYNISWASFAIVEVMSQNKFEHKRIGYLAANQVLLFPTTIPPFLTDSLTYFLSF